MLTSDGRCAFLGPTSKHLLNCVATKLLHRSCIELYAGCVLRGLRILVHDCFLVVWKSTPTPKLSGENRNIGDDVGSAIERIGPESLNCFKCLLLEGVDLTKHACASLRYELDDLSI